MSPLRLARAFAGPMLLLAALMLPALAFAAPGARWAGDHPRDKLIGDEALVDPWDPTANLRKRTEPGHLLLRGSFENCPHDYDVLHYEINFSSFTTNSNFLSGHTIIEFESEVDLLSSIHLDLMAPLSVSSVLLDGITPLGFSQSGDSLTVNFAALPDSGDTVSIDVAYSGQPWNEGGGGFGGFWFRGFPNTAFSMGIGLNAEPPSVASSWFPCWDWPCDKATVDLNLEVPLNRVAVANGLLVGVDSTATDHTFHWSHDFQTAPYLVACAVANYRTVADSIVTDPRITAYFHAGDRADADISYQNIDLMMQGLESRLGPYPFDKFAFMGTNIGDMEHQTCVSHSAGLVNGTNNYDPILAHEMTHQWFGDYVTYGTWADIWLSEGFATYGEALFREEEGGASSYHSYMTNQVMNQVINSGQTDGVYAPSNHWGIINYEKGGSVVHMLRGVLDDDAAFFQALRDFIAAHAYGNAISADLVADVEASTGLELSWFFDPWIWGEGHPVYEYGWSKQDVGGGNWQVDVSIAQVQTTANLFDMPVDFRVQTGSGDFDFSERIDLASETASFVVPAEPTGLLVDPDDWILDEQQLAVTSADWGPVAAAAQALALHAPRPNPVRDRTEIRYYLPEGGRTTVAIHDVAGRRVRTFGPRNEIQGSRALTWDRRDDTGGRVAAGVYWVRLTTAKGESRSAKAVVVD